MAGRRGSHGAYEGSRKHGSQYGGEREKRTNDIAPVEGRREGYDKNGVNGDGEPGREMQQEHEYGESVKE